MERLAPARRRHANVVNTLCKAGPAAGAETAQWHPVAQLVYRALNEAGVTWCLIRIPPYPHAPTGDIDLLVLGKHFQRVCHVLVSCGFARVPTLSEGCGLFLTYDRQTRAWLTLEVVTRLDYGPGGAIHTRLAQGCLDRRELRGEVWLLSADDSFWTLIAHCLFDKTVFAPNYRTNIERIVRAARTDSAGASLVASLCPPAWSAERIVDCARCADWEALEVLRPAMLRRSRRAIPKGLATVAQLKRLPKKPLLLRSRRGLSVALIGANGAGKSTLATALSQSFALPSRSVYFGLWSDGHGKPRQGWLAVIARPMVALSRYVEARYHQSLGRLVIFDRYPYDALLPPSEPLLWLKRPYMWLIGHLCPAPDMLLLLDAPGPVTYERKHEQTLPQAEAERQAFLRLGRRLPNAELVDADRDKADILGDVTDRIWRRYAARWSALACS